MITFEQLFNIKLPAGYSIEIYEADSAFYIIRLLKFIKKEKNTLRLLELLEKKIAKNSRITTVKKMLDKVINDTEKKKKKA